MQQHQPCSQHQPFRSETCRGRLQPVAAPIGDVPEGTRILAAASRQQEPAPTTQPPPATHHPAPVAQAMASCIAWFWGAVLIFLL